MHRRQGEAKAMIALAGLKGKPVAELCTEHQISQAQYYQGWDQFLAHASKAFEVHPSALGFRRVSSSTLKTSCAGASRSSRRRRSIPTFATVYFVKPYHYEKRCRVPPPYLGVHLAHRGQYRWRVGGVHGVSDASGCCVEKPVHDDRVNPTPVRHVKEVA